MNDVEWSDIARRSIGERWPRWGASDTQRADWKRTLKEFSKKAVDEALFRVRKRYASDEPKLNWVVKELTEMRREDRALADAAKRDEDHIPRDAAVLHLRQFTPETLDWVRSYVLPSLPQRTQTDTNNDSSDPAAWSDDLVYWCHRVATSWALTPTTKLIGITTAGCHDEEQQPCVSSPPPPTAPASSQNTNG